MDKTLGPAGATPPVGVKGWLLALCLLLTVVAPLACLDLMTSLYQAVSPRLAHAPGLYAAVVVSLAATACSAAFGVYAGWGLWVRRPGAVATAKLMLLFGLGVDLLTTSIELGLDTEALPGSRALDALIWHMAPSLLVFSACYGYLNRSERVRLTYQPKTTAPTAPRSA
jgi:ABC-type spermidine/putrescine transport system permease subunit II